MRNRRGVRRAAVAVALAVLGTGTARSGENDFAVLFGEAFAAMTMLDLAAAQDLVKRTAAIDADGDGVGEYATLMELAGAVGRRTRAAGADGSAGSDFTSPGERLPSPLVPAALGAVDGFGLCVSQGYVYAVFLPDASQGPAMVREAGPPESPRVEGGTGTVGADAAETRWIGFAQPLVWDENGRAIYAIGPSRKLLRCENTRARLAGRAAAVDWRTLAGGGTPAAGAEGPGGEPWLDISQARGPMLESALNANETAAISTLRNVVSCQSQAAAGSRIDVDFDGQGEFGTFLELSGAVGVRADLVARKDAKDASSFAMRSSPIDPPVLSGAFQRVDGNGFVVRTGYVFQMFLPGSTPGIGASPEPAAVHETGPARNVSLTGPVGIDLAETTFCCYAWPVEYGRSGRRVFFVNQSGDITASANDARFEGTKKGIDPGSAFRRGDPGIVGLVAVGTVGNDGSVWRQVN